MNGKILNKLLIFGGTTEGRVLTEKLLERGFFCTVCVATAYGGVMMTAHPRLCIHTGRLDGEEICDLMRSEAYQAVIDATHPFAEKVSAAVKEAAGRAGLTYYRLARETCGRELPAGTVLVDSVREAAMYLNEQEGRVFLTTGSKELPVITEAFSDISRLIVRILPMKESLDICSACGVFPSQIIAMQGPFDKELNKAMMRSKGVSFLLTKETGLAGGLQSKLDAAAELGVNIVMIRNPERDRDHVMTEAEVLSAVGGNDTAEDEGIEKNEHAGNMA